MRDRDIVEKPLASYHLMGFTVGLSLIGVVLWGSLMGSMLPFVLRAFKLDPAAISAPLVATLVRQARLVDFSTDQIDALTYGRAMDTSRFTAETGLVPQYSSLAALDEFVSAAKPGLLTAERVDGALAAVGQLLKSAKVRSG